MNAALRTLTRSDGGRFAFNLGGAEGKALARAGYRRRSYPVVLRFSTRSALT